MKNEQKIGIIGGSGFYSFLKGKEVSVNTPYGKPSDKILLSEYAGKKIAFLPRHGKHHQFPPHKIPYQANLFALKKLGCEIIIAPCTVGSLQAKIKPGHFVIPDQFIDRTKNRIDTYYHGPKACPPKCHRDFGRVAHISMADPYCSELCKLAVKCCQKIKVPVHKTGTMVVIEGSRFSSRAESRWFSKIGGDIVGMTQYPEVTLARELEMCYVGIALVTDYDAGLEGCKNIKPVDSQTVIKIFNQNNEKVRKVILEIIKNLPEQQKCLCGQALKNAIL
ncbi:MAG: S-methyl-5'-thioadenosine phosphorylase [Patescibacteria group bacterium]